jgi:hypothetical protein
MRASSYREFILAATGDKAIFVPEPSMITQLVSVFAILALDPRNRRHIAA